MNRTYHPNRQHRWSRIFAVTTALVLLASSCSLFGDDDETTPDGGAGGGPVGITGAGSAGGFSASDILRIRLSEGQRVGSAAAELAVVDGTPLTDDQVAAILQRLPELEPDPDERQEFNRPPSSLRPPLVGETIDTVFPPAPPAGTDDPTPASGPLEVLRFQPEGDVAVAPFLSVTFNQPMVDLATLDQLQTAAIPVQIEPAVDGRWRWIGTRTLRFELEPGPIDRLPAATDYTVTIPAGVSSASGTELADTVTFAFSTPAPRVANLAGLTEAVGARPVLVAVFDQRVDPGAVLETTSLTVDGDDAGLRIATDDEIKADDIAARAVAAALDGRYVALTPTDPLAPASDLVLTIGPGTPSSEGPRTSAEAATFDGRTFDALAVTERTCAYGSRCLPGSPFIIAFNNPIDAEQFDPATVGADPAIPGMRVGVFGNQLTITGATRARTDYTIKLPATLTDVFGQTLGEEVEARFEVGPAQTQLVPFNQQYLTVDPMADRPGVSVTTVNHDSVRVTAWRVTAADLGGFQRYLERFWSDTDPGDPDWPEVFDGEIDIDGDDDRAVETLVDLSDAFADSPDRQLVVRVTPTREFERNDDEYWMNRPSVAWVQATTLGIDAVIDNDQMLIWTTDLVTGEPRPGVDVELVGSGSQVTTDDGGVARADLSGRVRGLLGRDSDRSGSDAVALLASSWYEGWQAQEGWEEGRWYVFDDRGIYKPGETVRVTGWLRRQSFSGDAQLELYDGTVNVRWTAYDPFGNEVGSGNATANRLGGFNFSFDVPDESNLGFGYVDMQATGSGIGRNGAYWGHQYQVQDFRTPEFEVIARPESPPPYYVVEPATVAVDAAYFAGGPLPDADVDWTVTSSQTTYRPPRWDQFTFGIWQPWWFEGGRFGPEFGFESADVAFGIAEEFPVDCFGPDCPSRPDVERFSGRTDADGHHYLRLDFDGPDVDLPTTVTAEAAVTDVNRQVWASRTNLLVHPARYYVGIRSDRPFVEQGTPLRIDAVVTDVDGASVPGRAVEVTAGRLEEVWSNGEWVEQLADEQTCTVASVALDPATAGGTDDAAARPEEMRCEFDTDLGGRYRVSAVVTDDDGHRNRSELTIWVSGADARPNRRVTQEAVTIIPDAETYAPGDTAQLLVQAPFAPASGLVTISRGGIVSSQTFETDDGSSVIEIPIEEQWIPNVTVQVDMVGTAPRLADDGTALPDAPPRPAYASGQLNLRIPPVTRTLDVVAEPADAALSPGDDTAVKVTVKDPDGRPVSGADVALIVVDEAVLSLTGYDLPDPLSVFYQDIYSQAFTEYTRAGIVLHRADFVDGSFEGGANGGDDEESAESADTAAADDFDVTTTQASRNLEAPAAALAEGEAGAGGSGSPIAVRSDFDALAVYAPSESTGPSGTVTVDVPLPDNLTRYRVMAVAVDGADQFGKGESTIAARLPLMVRPSAPRFLNFGDRFELPVVVQNQTDETMEVDVAVEGSNLSLTAGSGRRVTVPANDRIEVRFLAAAEKAGTARFRVAGVDASGAAENADAALVELPVYTPATAEAFATYGTIEGSTRDGGDGLAAIAQPLTTPEGVFPQFGGLEITTSSTAVQALTDAVLYLHDYRYDSAEGYASRIMAVAALRDVLDAFDADGLPAPSVLNARVQRDIERLSALQNDDGGFPYWQRGRESIPWTSIQATHALVLAKEAGFRVDAGVLARAADRLATIESLYEPTYSDAIRASLSAYALNVRDLSGDADPGKALDVYREYTDVLQPDGLAWLWPVLTSSTPRSEIERTLLNRATDTAGAATFATGYDEGETWLISGSDRRTDGIVLGALISEAPDSDLIPKVVNGLLGGQIRGRWNNAIENGFILVALHDYFETFEDVTPDFVARAWLGDDYVAEYAFEGRTTDRANTLVPMADVIAAGDTRVVVARDGAGRLYYRLGLRYAPDDLVLGPRDEGFVVDRIYEGAEPGDVSRNADGTWRIKSGATVRVTLTMVADAARTHVALIDPLPAGLEPLNPALAVSATPPQFPSDDDDDDGGFGPEPRFDLDWCWCWNWYQHQNLRDDRAEAFTSYLPGGVYTFSYTARATTPGAFVVPPARAEEMYAPETFGRSSSARVVVEE